MLNEASAIPDSVLNLFRPTTQSTSEEIDFGARFLKPPPMSTSNSLINPALESDYLSASNSPDLKVANLISKLNNLASPIVGNLNFFADQPQSSNKIICSTPINAKNAPISNFGSSVLYNGSQMNHSAFNYSTSPTAAKNYWDRERVNSFGNAFSQSRQQQSTKQQSRHLNSYSSDLSHDSDDLFDKNWQDNKQSSVFYSAYSGIYVDQILRQAKLHRNAASYSNATCTWRGQLLTRQHTNSNLSPKIFLGGVPWDLNEQNLVSIFSKFGSIKVQWPGREIKCSRGNSPLKCGYVYIIFENQEPVKALLRECIYDNKNGGKWFYNMPTKRMPMKQVQIVPWFLADSNWVKNPVFRLDPSKTCFVGALHGMITAESLARVMDDLFGNVVYVGIDTDGFRYPRGSARVSFSSTKSYIRAIMAGFVEIKSNKFNKKIQVDPYLQNSDCSHCRILQGPVFCRSLSCFRYYCPDCYYWIHLHKEFKNHYPIMRKKSEKQ